MKKLIIKSKEEPWSAINITDEIQKEIAEDFNGLLLIYSPDTEVNILTGEYDEVLPIDYSRTAQNILAEARPYTAENGEAYTFNFMRACEKVIPVTDGKSSVGMLLQVYLFDAVGGGKDRVLWLYELEG